MSKRSSREREQVAWEIYRAKAKLVERKKLIEVLNRYLKQDEEQLEELMSSGIV
jgi:rubrerythrin